MDLTRIHSNMISGLTSEEVSFLEMLTHQKNNIDQFTGLEFQATNSKDDDSLTFPELDDDVVKEIIKLEKEAENKSTGYQTNFYVNKFKQFLRENNIPDCIETMPERYLGSYLRFWYSRLRKADGTQYAPSTLICARAAIQRHMLSHDCSFNIIDGEHFRQANFTLKSVIAMKLREKVSISKNGSKFQALEDGDLTKLQAYFTRSNPVRLQHEVFFPYTLPFRISRTRVVAQY